MNNKFIESLRIKVCEALETDNMRYQHSLGVANTCACLAMRYDVDMNRAYIAGLLHDCAKCIPDDVKISQCREFNLPISDVELSSPYLLHAKLGAYYAKHLYNIDDEEICSAIEFHTTGKPGMTLLEQIVFVADYIEPYRNKANELDLIRHTAFEDIDKATYMILSDTIKYVKQSGRELDTSTLDTWNFYNPGKI